MLADKYDATGTVSIAVRAKKWLLLLGTCLVQPACPGLQDLAMIYMVCGEGTEFDCIIDCLAFKTTHVIDNDSDSYCYSKGDRKVKLRPDISDQTLSGSKRLEMKVC